MDCVQFRRTGELSDITVVVDKTDFKLHKFPLFTKSNYFKKVITSISTPYVIKLDSNFPGDAQVFDVIADYFYSIPISITRQNIVALWSATCFLECDQLYALLNERFTEIILDAQVKYDLNTPFSLLEQCTDKYRPWVKQTRMIDKCLESIIESLAMGIDLQINKLDLETIAHLSVDWIIELFKLCPTESKYSILPLVQHYVTVHVFEQNQTQSSEKNEGGHSIAAADTPATEKGIPTVVDDKKRRIIDQIVETLEHTMEKLPLVWLNSIYEKAVELKCKSEPLLSSCITQAVLNSTDLDDGLENIPDDVTIRLLERVSEHKENHIKDPHLLAKLSAFIDSYVEQLRQRGALTSEQFVKLASCIPKEKRFSHDSLLLALDELLKNENSTQLSDIEREELLNHIDFSRVNEETIAACKNNKFIPQQLIGDAALALCVKLRRQLEETQNHLYSVESELTIVRATSVTSSKYRSRRFDTLCYIPSRSRVTVANTYDLQRSSLTSDYLTYNHDADLDYLFPTSYLSSTSNTRYGSYFMYPY